MKKLFFLGVFLLAGMCIFAQQNKPKVDIQVNKKYDENGNIIQYDSTYTYYYSSDANTMNSDIADSLLNHFNNGFSFFNFNNDDMFNMDPFNMKDPFMSDPFFQEFNRKQMEIFNQFFNETDSLHLEKNSNNNPANSNIKGISL